MFNRHTLAYASYRSKDSAQSVVSLLKSTKVSLSLNANPQAVFRIAKVMPSAMQVNVAASHVQGN